MNLLGCFLCAAYVPTGPAFLVSSGFLTGEEGARGAELVGVLCADRDACLARVRQGEPALPR